MNTVALLGAALARALPMAVLLTTSTVAPAAPPQGFVVDSIGGTFTSVVGAIPLPDGRIIAWERTGKLWMIGTDGVRLSTPVLDISDEVQGGGDEGMLGLALHPDFPTKPYIYALYAVDRHHLLYAGTPQYSATTNLYYQATIARVTRYSLDAQSQFRSTVPNSRCVLMGATPADGIPVLHASHSVGSLLFGLDGTLLIMTGENSNFSVYDNGGAANNPNVTNALAEGIIRPAEDVGAFRSQLVNSHCGKVLRIDAESGDGVPSNPWFLPDQPRAPQSRVWTVGVRNPFRASMVPGTGSHDPLEGNPGTIMLVDVGSGYAEETNFIKSGGLNLGWPLFEGQTRQMYFWRAAAANADEVTPGSGPIPFHDLIAQDSLVEHEFFDSRAVTQAESATRSTTTEVRNHHPGFSGGGYLYIPTAAWAEASAPSRTAGTLAVRYMNAETLPVNVTVTPAGSPAISAQFPVTGSAQDWRIARVPFNFASTSGAPTVRISRVSGAALQIDALWIEQPGTEFGLPSSVRTFQHHRPELDWRVARTTTPGYNAAGAAVGISLGATGGAAGSPFTGNCGVGSTSIGAGSWPAQYQGHYFGDYGAGWIKFAKVDLGSRCGGAPGSCSCAQVTSVHDFDSGLTKLVGLSSDAAGTTIYAAQWTELRRYRWLPGGSLAPIVAVTQSAEWGPSPLSVTFDASGSSDPEGSPLNFEWTFSDGQPPATGAVVMRTFANSVGGPSTTRVTLRVTDAGGAQTVKELSVGLDNSPPVPQITSLVDGQLYPTHLDSQFALRGAITDAEHAAADIRCSWQVTLHHNAHEHPEPAMDACESSATLQATHCDADNAYWYEVSLTATDAAGLSGTHTVTLQPDCTGLLRCMGDVDGSGTVDGFDLANLLSQWGAPGITDIDRSGATDGGDLAELLSHWGNCAP